MQWISRWAIDRISNIRRRFYNFIKKIKYMVSPKSVYTFHLTVNLKFVPFEYFNNIFTVSFRQHGKISVSPFLRTSNHPIKQISHTSCRKMYGFCRNISRSTSLFFFTWSTKLHILLFSSAGKQTLHTPHSGRCNCLVGKVAVRLAKPQPKNAAASFLAISSAQKSSNFTPKKYHEI